MVGGTSAGVVKYYPPHTNDAPTVFINIAGVKELRNICSDASSVTFGASVTISEVIDKLSKLPGQQICRFGFFGFDLWQVKAETIVEHIIIDEGEVDKFSAK